MAVVWILRLAIAVAPVVARVCKTSGCDAQAATNAIARLGDRLFNPDEDPDQLSAEASAALGAEGGFFVVTDFTGTYELRKLQWRLSRAPTGGTTEDQDVMTFHFIKATGGVPGTYNDTTDLAAVETAVGAFWTSNKPLYPSFVHSDQYRWYKDGPAFWHTNTAGTKVIPVVPNPAIRVTEVDVAGTAAGTSFNPPQTATSVTEITSSRKNWGRFYLPATNSLLNNASGRMAPTDVDAFVATCVTMYNACRTASMVPVVFSIPKLARPTAGGGELPAQAAIAFEISAIQVDDLFDVIRRRRYSAPVYRKKTLLT